MNDYQEYFLIRRKKKLRLTKIAEYIGCSQSLLSRFETGDCLMSDDKIEKYKKYIENN
ncbi:helix-turn-helix domain-containing protein [Virgibacillus natechei]